MRRRPVRLGIVSSDTLAVSEPDNDTTVGTIDLLLDIWSLALQDGVSVSASYTGCSVEVQLGEPDKDLELLVDGCTSVKATPHTNKGAQWLVHYASRFAAPAVWRKINEDSNNTCGDVVWLFNYT
jgi:hypothetical protein